MSALPADIRPGRERVGDAGRASRLRPVARPERRVRPRLAYAVVALVSIGVIVAAQLLLSIAVTQGAYEIDAHQLRRAELAIEAQKLGDDLDRVESPQFLAANAEALGMVPNSNPVYLRLSDRAVLGEPAAAGGGAASAPVVANALIDGVPLVTQLPDQVAAGAAPAEGAPGATPNPDAATGAAAPPPPPAGLPTPTTH